MEKLHSPKDLSIDILTKVIFDTEFERFAQGNAWAFRGKTIEIEGNNIGHRRAVFITETADGVTAEHLVFSPEFPYSHQTGAIKLMKDRSPTRVWNPSSEDQNGALLFAIGVISGQEATPEQIADFTPLLEALEEIESTSETD